MFPVTPAAKAAERYLGDGADWVNPCNVASATCAANQRCQGKLEQLKASVPFPVQPAMP